MRCHARGFSLVESVVATLLVGLLVVASLQALAASLDSQSRSADLLRATLLAEQLLTELSALPWTDPQDPATAGTIGPDSDDPASPAARSQLDDLDDFDDWSETPPADAAGAPLLGMATWTRTVTIRNIAPDDGATELDDDDDRGLRRITVRITQGGETLAELSALTGCDGRSLPTDPWEVSPVPE